MFLKKYYLAKFSEDCKKNKITNDIECLQNHEDDLSENLQSTTVSNDATLSNLRNVIIEKIDVTSNAIEKENDVAKQAVLVDLLQKYVALLKECEDDNESDTNSEES